MEFCAEKLTVLFFILIHRVIEAPKVRPSVVVVGFLVKKASNSKMTLPEPHTKTSRIFTPNQVVRNRHFILT